MLGMSIALAAAAVAGPPPARSEYDIKAAFLYKFAVFAEWPSSALGNTNTPFTIAILGRDPFGERLEGVIRQQAVHQRSLRFRRYDRVAEALAEPCHVLFIAASEQSRLPEILSGLGSAPILTVGDTEGYGAGGVMLNLLVRDRGVRFEINQPAVSRVGLRVSAQLLDLAVKPGSPPKAKGP